MITGSFTIYGIEDVQQDMLVLSPRAVTVTAYNEQKSPLIIRLNHLTGAQSDALKAFIRVRIMSVDLELGQQDFGLCSEASYTLPQGKWGNATRIIVEAFADEAKQNLITSDEVSILAENPTPFPIAKPWGPGERYKNGEYLLDGNIVYMWRNRVTGNTLTSPSKVTASDPFYGSWERYDQWAVLATLMMLAKSALIGSSVFDGDYTISQHGQSKGTNPETGQPYDYRDFDAAMSKFIPNFMIDWLSVFDGDYTISQHGQSKGTNPETGQPYDYRDFDAAMSKFIPNFMIDWLRGKVVGMDMEIKGGKVANFNIRGGILKCDSYARNAVVLRDEINNTISILGSPLRPSTSAGLKLGMYYYSENSAVNLGLKSIAKGSTISQDMSDPCLGYLNLAIDAIGGANILPEVTDRWCVPGVLKVLEIRLSPGEGGRARVERLREWGHGIRFRKGEAVYTSNCENDAERTIYFEYYCKHEMVYLLPINNSPYDYKSSGFFNFTPMVETSNALIDSSNNIRRMGVTWWDYKNTKRVPQISTYVFIGLPSPEPGYVDFLTKKDMDDILNNL